MNSDRKPNKLINSASPYLLQHAYNPVDWNPWSTEAFERAEAEDKPVIVSIGYSACHWCHVMERESFEDPETARIMNENFICIKVDREERPDIDAIYMDAVHALGMRGGWPLNVFITPAQKPFFGGTYFPPQHWKKILNTLSTAWKNEKEKIIESSEAITEAISSQEHEHLQDSGGITPQIKNVETMTGSLKPFFDNDKGGMSGSPKFPMPSIWHFLLRAGSALKDDGIIRQVEVTLDAMARGGIYDQMGGGFSRYSVDDRWFAPHFEKMLYDNGQMLSLYADAWRVYRKEEYKQIACGTYDFLIRELLSPEGAFYSALDADSDGIEGRYYVWSFQEIKKAAGDDADIFTGYYNVSESGNWEHGQNILHRSRSLSEAAEKSGLSEDEFTARINKIKQRLFDLRSERTRPGLDDKILAGWNGLVLKGLCDAYTAFGDRSFLESAVMNAGFIKEKMIHDGTLYRSYKDGKFYTPGCLEDYALVIQGFISLYQADFDEIWLYEADRLCRRVLENFSDNGQSLLFFTDSGSDRLIARKKEIYDNVIPSSNSVMAMNIYLLGKILSEDIYLDAAGKMLGSVAGVLNANLQHMSNWANLYLFKTRPTAEIAICGPEFKLFKSELEALWIPNKVTTGSAGLSSIPLLLNRLPDNGSTKIYVCFDKSCSLPADSVDDALERIKYQQND
jgi:hypothetical protein